MEVAFLLRQNLSHGLGGTKGTNIISQENIMLLRRLIAQKITTEFLIRGNLATYREKHM